MEITTSSFITSNVFFKKGGNISMHYIISNTLSLPLLPKAKQRKLFEGGGEHKKITKKSSPESLERPWQLLLLLKLDSQVGIIGKHSKTRRTTRSYIFFKEYTLIYNIFNQILE